MTRSESERADTAGTAKVRDERDELLAHVQAILEPALIVLGLIFLGLLLLDYGVVALGSRSQQWVGQALQVIWGIFLLDFLVRLAIAPAKGAFLRQNWLTVLSLVLPFLRPLRIFRAARALRSLSLARFLGGINRGMRVLRQVTHGRQVAFVGTLTVVVVLAGAVGVLFFDRGVEGAPIQTFGDALWWSAAMVTTINNEQYVVSPEARVLAILQRIYALSVFGYITASIASYLVGNTTRAADPTLEVLREEIVALRKDLAVDPPAARDISDGSSMRRGDVDGTAEDDTWT